MFWLEEAGLPITGANIARAMQLSAPTVHEMIGRLEHDGYVVRADDKSLSFTDDGRAHATAMVRRHRLIERFLTDVLGIPWDEVHEEAERLEHAMSPVLEERMMVAIGDAKTCPHGHPLVEGVREHGVLLADVEPGATVTVLRFENEAEELLHYLKASGLRPGLDGTLESSDDDEVVMASDGGIVVGEAAERRALTDPDRVVREFKRRIGDPTPIVVGGRSWAPEELSARLVRWVVDRVAEREGGPAAQIAVTHPAAWGSHKKDLLTAALAAQGLRVTLLAEPQAAAFHYATQERVAPGSTIAVYDLGGGTFDAAVVRKADRSEAAFGATGFGLLGRPEGLDRLGGIDFDDVVFDHVREGLPAAFSDLDDTDTGVLSAVARVRRECTEAKEALSADTDVSIPVLLPAGGGSVRLHRTEFESMIRPQVEETVDALRSAVHSAGCRPGELSAVLLVGGSSRIPLVAQLVSEGLARPVAVDTHPKNAIAKGAAQ